MKSINSVQQSKTKDRSKFSGFWMIIFLSIHSISFGQSSQTAIGTTYTNSAISGSNSSWTSISNANSSDDVYVVTSANLPHNGDFTDYLKITNFQFTIPLGSTISGIEVNVECSDANGKSKDSKVSIVKGGAITSANKALNPAWSGTDNVKNYGGNNDTWSNSWSVTDINSSGFGFAFSAKRAGGGGQPTSSKIDQVYITVYYTTPLPIQLVDFDANYVGDAVGVEWETASEMNNDYFSIEKSGDGISYEVIAQIKGVGNSTINQVYSYTDEAPLSGTSYYRLKQTDYDGQSETFKAIAVKTAEKIIQPELLTVYPNTFSESFSAKVNLKESGNVELQMINSSGITTLSEKVYVSEGINVLEFNNNANLKAGVYYIRLVKANQVLSTVKALCVK